MNYIFELNQDSNEINYTYEEYSNEITSIKDISNNLYNTITEENRNNNTINTDNKTNKKCKLLCNNFIKLNNCRWHKDNKCKFAHSYEELDDMSKKKVLELGLQTFYYFFNLNKDLNKNTSIFDLSNIFKNAEILYKKETIELTKMKTQYSDLHNYLFKLKKQMNLQHEISSIDIVNHFDTLKLNNNLNLDKTIIELKELINTTVGCKICYKNIIELNDSNLNIDGIDGIDGIENTNDNLPDIFNTFNIINLSCGHSICEYCHIELINKKTTIYIECPICRELNNIKNTCPNYELNEQIFKIKLIISKLGCANKMIKNEYNLLKFVNRDFYNTFNKLRNPNLINNKFDKFNKFKVKHTMKETIKRQTHEAPW